MKRSDGRGEARREPERRRTERPPTGSPSTRLWTRTAGAWTRSGGQRFARASLGRTPEPGAPGPHRSAAVVRAVGLLLALLGCGAFVAPADAEAQRRPDGFDGRGGGGGCRAHLPDPLPPNAPYDGRFTFVRISFDRDGGDGRDGGRGRRWGRRGWGMPGWAHDYPCAELNFMSILDEITTVRLYRDGGNILTLDDPELFRYPVAYISEPGGWMPTDEQVENLRAYLLKGGFVIFDDFSGRDWYNFTEQIGRVLPEHELIPLDVDHPVFHAFFEVETLDFDEEGWRARSPEYYGIFENNDPTDRLMVVVNYNNDIGDYWEYSHTGFLPIPTTNEAFKIGVNYVMYALTH